MRSLSIQILSHLRDGLISLFIDGILLRCDLSRALCIMRHATSNNNVEEERISFPYDCSRGSCKELKPLDLFECLFEGLHNN